MVSCRLTWSRCKVGIRALYSWGGEEEGTWAICRVGALVKWCDEEQHVGLTSARVLLFLFELVLSEAAGGFIHLCRGTPTSSG